MNHKWSVVTFCLFDKSLYMQSDKDREEGRKTELWLLKQFFLFLFPMPFYAEFAIKMSKVVIVTSREIEAAEKNGMGNNKE